MISNLTTVGRPRVRPAGLNFKVRRRNCPGYPIVIEFKGTVIEPIDHYLRSRIFNEGLSTGSATDEAHILADWWHYMHTGDRRRSAITRTEISRWYNDDLTKACQRSKPRSRRAARVKRRLLVVQKFLQHSSQRATEWMPIASKSLQLSRSLFDRLAPEWAATSYHIRPGRTPARIGPGRPTPKPQEVEAVFETLANSSPYRSARDFLCARWMYEVGLRRSGVSSLSVPKLSACLIAAGLERSHAQALSDLDYGGRCAVRGFLGSLRVRGISLLEVLITEKGSREAEALTPIDLIEDTLEFIWTARSDLIRRRGLKNVSAIWLSLKTGDAMTARAIGDVMKCGFNAANVRGSGHRLRAAFAEKCMWETLEEARTLDPDGLFLDDEHILTVVTERMRQASVESLRPYLNRARRYYLEEARFRTRSAN